MKSSMDNGKPELLVLTSHDIDSQNKISDYDHGEFAQDNGILTGELKILNETKNSIQNLKQNQKQDIIPPNKLRNLT